MPEQGTDFLSRLFLGIRCKFKLLVFLYLLHRCHHQNVSLFVTGHILDDIFDFCSPSVVMDLCFEVCKIFGLVLTWHI